MVQPRTIMPKDPTIAKEDLVSKGATTVELDLKPTLVPRPSIPTDTTIFNPGEQIRTEEVIINPEGDVVDLVETEENADSWCDEPPHGEEIRSQERHKLLLLGIGILAAALLFRK